mmetsp:Transcript_25795/g.48547  ORF Transcript_25795/g.48547 Transcript_25795/m.48547 type:complete len:1405 (-) Transcript_25795:362-4576(-)
MERPVISLKKWLWNIVNQLMCRPFLANVSFVNLDHTNKLPNHGTTLLLANCFQNYLLPPTMPQNTENYTKMVRMRTSWDVITRLQHDPVFKEGRSIYIGYIDFGNLIEKPFKAFSNWGNIENASLHDLAIPQHRIRHFRHANGVMLWNKDERLDLIFGSTAPFKTCEYSELEEKEEANGKFGDAQTSVCHTPLQFFLGAHNLTAFSDIRNVLTGTGFGCKVKRGVGLHSSLYLVMYSDQRYFTSQSDLATRNLSAGNPSACLDHCRGVIYEMNTNILVCAAFDKFWESYDPRSAINVINWSPGHVKVHEKCDGSLTKVFYYKGRWNIASNGCLNADRANIPGSSPPVTVGKLFKQAALTHFQNGWDEMQLALNRDYTYSFELCHPASRVVVFHRRAKLIHLNTRNQRSGAEVIAHIANIEKPSIIKPGNSDRHSLEDLQSLANSLPSQCEGFVVTDSENNRVKIKGKEYLRAHGDVDLNTNVWFHILSGWIFEENVPDDLSSPLGWKDLLPREYKNKASEVEQWFRRNLEEIAGNKDGRSLLRREGGRVGGVITVSPMRKELERRCARPLPPFLPPAPAPVRRAVTTQGDLDLLARGPTLKRASSLPTRLSHGAGRILLNELFSLGNDEQPAMKRLAPGFSSESPSESPPKYRNGSVNGSRPNFFICIKVDDPEILKNVREFQSFLVACDPRLAASIQPHASLHITLNTFLATDKTELTTAINALSEKLPEVLASALPADYKIEVGGTGAFSTTSDVIFAKTNSTNRIQSLCQKINNILEKAGIATPGNRTNVAPHLTINKLSRSQSRSGRVNESFWRPTHGSKIYGSQSCRFGVQICPLLKPSDVSSFYPVAATILPSGGEALHSTLDNLMTKFDVVILRGLPGVGKSTLIDQAKEKLNDVVDGDFDVASADKFFEASGEYVFERKLLGKAHDFSRSVAAKAMEENRTVVVDNTNTTAAEVGVYIDMAERRKKSCAVFDLCSSGVADARNLRNKHGVCVEAIERMFDRWEVLDASLNVPIFVPPKVGVGEVLLYDVNYFGVFLTEESKQRMQRLNTKVSEMVAGTEGDDVIIQCDHVTIAHEKRMKREELAKLSSMLGRHVNVNVVAVATDDFSTVCKVSVDDVDIVNSAAACQQTLHLTLSHDKSVKAARSNDILECASRAFLGKPIEGILGYYSKRGRKAVYEVNQFRAGGGPLFIFDLDRTLLMTSSRETYEKLHGRWNKGSFYDSPASLASNLPVSAGPAMAVFKRLKKEADGGATFVLLTGRIEGLEREVRAALDRCDAPHFDRLILRPRERVTQSWKAEVVGQLSKQFERVVSWDDDVTARDAIRAELDREGCKAPEYLVLDERSDERVMKVRCRGVFMGSLGPGAVRQIRRRGWEAQRGWELTQQSTKLRTPGPGE